MGSCRKGDRRHLLSSPCLRTAKTAARTAAPNRYRYGASGFAAGQPRKPEAALVVDWFYALPPCQWLPREGDRSHPFQRKRSGERHQTVLSYTMRPERGDVKAGSQTFQASQWRMEVYVDMCKSAPITPLLSTKPLGFLCRSVQNRPFSGPSQRKIDACAGLKSPSVLCWSVSGSRTRSPLPPPCLRCGCRRSLRGRRRARW